MNARCAMAGADCPNPATLERGEADVDVWVAPETELEMAAARG